MNLKELKELIDLIQNSEVVELELEKAGVRVRIKKQSRPVAASPLPEGGPPAAPPIQETVTARSHHPPATHEREGVLTMTSPVVGTFYRAPAPQTDSYVEIGSIVKKGQILCVIEAMKLMNEIESESDGKIVEILVDNAQPVEYGEPLFRIDSLTRT